VLNALGYGTSKAAVIGMTRDLAGKWASSGCGSMHCARMLSPRMTAALLNDPVHRRAIAEGIPMGGVGEADDIKGLAIFLASDAARYITGQVFAVDGGQGAM
jgi:NAD(P)-dependent dehydrogenase (short-subunit alcohol dehydrogenase family)